MDGVLTNFEKAAEALMGDGFSLKDLNNSRRHMSPQNAAKKTELYQSIIKESPRFWEELEWMPNGKATLNHLYLLEALGFIRSISILTAPLDGDEYCPSGKRKWIEKNLGVSSVFFDEIFIDKNKHEYVGRMNKECPQVLIDDRVKNIEDWKAHGGYGILYDDSNFEGFLKDLDDCLRTSMV